MEARIKISEPVFSELGIDQQVTDWGVNVIMAPQAWKVTKGEGIKVAVLDTGIDTSHPDLIPNIKGGVNFTTSDRNDYVDRQGHGTHCAGIIAGCDNGIGVVGVAPKADLYAVKVLADNGSGDLNWIIQGVDWAIQNKMDIISMSLGCESEPPAVFHEAFKRAYNAGIPVVVAAGNEAHYVDWPAAYPETISVAAVDPKLARAGFSNAGAQNDIAAPGVDIYSTFPVAQYAKLSGTSMATPMVAGALALMIAKYRKEGASLGPASYRQMLVNSSVDLGTQGKDADFGNGLINLAKLLA